MGIRLLELWLCGLALLLAACGSTELGAGPDEPTARPRQRPQDWGYSNLITTCTASADDDVCERCEKKSCCAEVEACVGACQAQFSTYQQCLYPSGAAWSGFGSQACKQRALALVPGSTAVADLIDCTSSACGTPDACGAEPRAVFTFPPPVESSDFSAAQFLESYCAGCHFEGFLGPTGKPTSALSRDPAWWSPRWNAQWFAFMDYEIAVEKAPAIRCGVSQQADFSNDCLTLPAVPPSFFTGPAKFPPSGMGMYGGAPNPCRFAPDGITCPQPTDFERARLLSWLADGTPR